MISPFDPKLEHTFIAKYLANPRLVILLLLLIIIVGVSSYITLPRTLNPEVKIAIVLVQTALPGANPGDVEKLVTVPLEDSVRSIEKVKTVTSSSRDSISIISIEFNSGADPDKAKDAVQSAIDTVTDLPIDATKPRVQKLDFENQSVWRFALTSNFDDGSLFTFAKSLATKLKDLPEIDKVELSGIEQTEVEITIEPQSVATYGIGPLEISRLVTSSLKSFPAGAVNTTSSSFALTIDPAVTKIDDIRNLRVNVAGNNIALSDIARISEHPKPDQTQSFLASKDEGVRRSITVDVFRVSSINIDKAVGSAEKLVESQLQKSDDHFHVVTLINTLKEIDDQFNELTRDFFITISLVMLVLFVFLGTRQALVSALSAPLSFLITFTVMRITGITHNFLSLFSLLLSLGLLVDDTVVVISAITSYYRNGKATPFQAGLLVWRDFRIPIFTTTVTTIWAFLPLLLATGIIGEFIKSIPIVVSTALAGSFFVSIFITLPLIILLYSGSIPRRVRILLTALFYLTFLGAIFGLAPKAQLFPLLVVATALFLFVFLQVRRAVLERIRSFVSSRMNRKRTAGSRSPSQILGDGIVSFRPINRRYRQIIEAVLTKSSDRRKAIAAVLIFSLFSFALLPTGFVKNEFFPKANQDILFVSLELPAGTNITKTREEALSFLEQLKDTPRTTFVTADIGSGFSAMEGIGSAGSNNVLFTLTLEDKRKRKKESGDIAQELRSKFGSYSRGVVNVQELSGGPPAGADIQIKLLGDDLAILDAYAGQIQQFLEKQAGITNVTKSIKPGTSKLTFVPDKAQLVQQGVNVDQIGLFLRTYASGFTIDRSTFGEGTDQKDITFRLESKSITSDMISVLAVPTPTGNVPLASLGKIVLEPNPTLITREDGKRTISVSAGVASGVNSQEKNNDLEKFASTLNLPEGYSWKTGGVNEENNQSVQSILQAMAFSFLLIIVTMVVQFSSFRRAIIVMLVIPLSISGVFIIFALTRTPLSFPALIGVLALFGIVVKNAILLVDKIVQNEKHGMPFVEAIADAAESRLEPIALTSFCTIVGLIPVTLSDPLWRGLGGAIIAGLAFSGTIMLFFIPIVYYYFFAPSKANR